MRRGNTPVTVPPGLDISDDVRNMQKSRTPLLIFGNRT